MNSPLTNKRTKPLLKQFVKKFIGVFVKSGNKESIRRVVFQLTKVFKKQYNKKNNPLSFLQDSLQKLKPGFNFIRVIKSGKLFMIPVSITDNHALFKAAFWLKKAAIAANKNDKTFAENLAKEIVATLQNTGMAINSLNAHIDLAIDNRPFMFFLKKKKPFNITSKKRAIGRVFNAYKKLLKPRKPQYNVYPRLSRHIRQRITQNRLMRHSIPSLSIPARRRIYKKYTSVLQEIAKKKSDRYMAYVTRMRRERMNPLSANTFFEREEQKSNKRLLRSLKKNPRKLKNNESGFYIRKNKKQREKIYATKKQPFKKPNFKKSRNKKNNYK